MLSLLSYASSDSWMNVKCTTCGMQFQTDEHMKYNQVRVHEYGETCNMYPREDCGYQGQDIISLQNHVSEAHSSIFEGENSNNLEDLVVETP